MPASASHSFWGTTKAKLLKRDSTASRFFTPCSPTGSAFDVGAERHFCRKGNSIFSVLCRGLSLYGRKFCNDGIAWKAYQKTQRLIEPVVWCPDRPKVYSKTSETTSSFLKAHEPRCFWTLCLLHTYGLRGLSPAVRGKLSYRTMEFPRLRTVYKYRVSCSLFVPRPVT